MVNTTPLKTKVAILRRHLFDKVPVSDLCVSATLNKQSSLDMAKNHYSTKPKRRNRSGKRKDTQRIKANMAKIKELERNAGRA